jgi:CheY-like chemotaxis protein
MNEHPILLVEDNAHEEALTIRALERAGIANEVIVARDGVQALEYLFARNGTAGFPDEGPSLILLDLKIPKLGGLEVLRRIRDDEALKVVPLVVLTSSAQEADLIESYRRGANSYIRKPTDFDQFSVAIRELGKYWLVLNEPPPLLAGRKIS